MAGGFISTGTTLTIGRASDTNVFTCNCLNISASASRPRVDTSHMATTDANGTNAISATSLPGKLVTRTIEVDIDFDPVLEHSSGTTSLFEVGDGTETVLLTWSDTGSTAWTGTGYVTDVNASSGLDERVQASLTIALTGTVSAGW